jgi:large subunit ribosomal protein L15
MPISRRIPKRGFNNQWAEVIKAVNVRNLNDWFDDGAEVTIDSLRAVGELKGRFDLFKVLGDGELTKKLRVSAHRFSKSAREKIEAAGGEVIVLPGKAPVKKGVKKGGRKAPRQST